MPVDLRQLGTPIETKDGAQSKADAAEDSAKNYADSEITDHANTTSDVHGIGDSDIASESSVQSKVDSHEDSTSGVHGVGDSDVASTADVAEKADDPHGNDAHSTDFSELDHDHTDTGESSVPVSGIDLPSVVVEKPEHLPIAELSDDESIELSVVVQAGETLEVYRWGAYDVGAESAPTGLDAELLDGGDVVQASENTIDSSDADTSIASHENTSGSVSVFKLRAKNDTGSAIDNPGVGSHFGYRVV